MIGNEGRELYATLLGDVKTVVIRHRKHGRRVWSRRKFPKTVIVTMVYNTSTLHPRTHTYSHRHRHRHTHTDVQGRKVSSVRRGMHGAREESSPTAIQIKGYYCAQVVCVQPSSTGVSILVIGPCDVRTYDGISDLSHVVVYDSIGGKNEIL